MKKKLKTVFNELKEAFTSNDSILLYLVSVLISLIFIKFKLKTVGLILIGLFTIGIIIYYGGVLMKRKKNKTKTETKKTKVTKVKSKSKKKKTLKVLLIICLVGAILLVIGVVGFCGYIVLNAPEFDPENLKFQASSIIFDNKNEELVTLGTEKRELVTYDQLPQVLIDAIIATEDSRFFQHNGFDAPRFIKASIEQVLKRGGGGASTISMQVVKNNFTSRKASIVRKFTDIYLSVFELERNYTKEEILEFYVNDNFLGSNSYGVEQASQVYFGKTVSELTLPEAALIAGLYQSPTAYDPYSHPEAAEKRRSTVLYLMNKHGYITDEEEEMANAIPVSSLLVGKNSTNQYQGVIDTIIEEVFEKTGQNPNTTPMLIYTTLDRSMQDVINDIYSGKSYTWVDDYARAGVSVINVETGEINALGTSRVTDAKAFNYATHLKRHPGSTAKPLFDYAPAMEYANYSTATLLVDEKWNYSNNGPEVGNWDGQYQGMMTLRYALMFSRNIPALKTFQQLKNSDINKFVTSVGIDPAYESGTFVHEAHSIGAFDGVSPVEMSGAYAAFSNGGFYIEPHIVNKIVYRDNQEEKEFKYPKERVMADSTAYMINYCLESAVSQGGFAGGASVYGEQVAAKTGTTNIDEETLKAKGIPSYASRDVWTVAYTREYSVAVWYGYEELSNQYFVSNGNEKDRIMNIVMNKAVPKTTKTFEVPSSVVAVTIEKETSPVLLASEFTPDDMKTVEYFKKGTEPTEVSTRYTKLNNVTDLKATTTTTGVNLTWKYVIPNDLTETSIKKYFTQSVFGKSGEEFTKNRLTYNANFLGTLGFGIYLEDEEGALTKVGFTTESEYTYKVMGEKATNLKIVVKTEYEKFKNNASDGVSTETKTTASPLTITFPSGTTLNLTKDSVITEELLQMTPKYEGKIIDDEDNLTTKITLKSENTTTEITSPSELLTLVKTDKKATYKITYKVTYKKVTIEKTQTINITEE